MGILPYLIPYIFIYKLPINHTVACMLGWFLWAKLQDKKDAESKSCRKRRVEMEITGCLAWDRLGSEHVWLHAWGRLNHVKPPQITTTTCFFMG